MTAKETVAKWTQMPVLGFDVESTCKNPHEDRIVTAALVRIAPGEESLTFNWLVNPGVDIPEGAAAIHGITTEHAAAHGQDPAVAVFEMSARLALWMGKGFPVVAFNAPFDLTMLEAENRRHGQPTLAERLAPRPVGPIIDPYVLDKKADKWRKNNCPHCDAVDRKLTGCAIHYGVALGDAAHSAEPDAIAAVDVFHAIVRKHPAMFAGMTIGSLHQAQVGWRREQMDGLRAYFDRKGEEHDGCDPSWPLLPTPTGART
jgi:DNA polymerase-3 subunit epsilon